MVQDLILTLSAIAKLLLFFFTCIRTYINKYLQTTVGIYLFTYLLVFVFTCTFFFNKYHNYCNYCITPYLLPTRLHSPVCRASHRYRGGHGFKSRWSVRIFFWASFATALVA